MPNFCKLVYIPSESGLLTSCLSVSRRAAANQGVFSERLLERINAWNFVNRYLSTDQPSSEVHDIFLASSLVTYQVCFNPVLMREQNYLWIYQALQIPILLVHAQDDEIVLPAKAEELLALRPEARVIRYNRGAYGSHRENAAQFNQELVNFVSAIP
jgi:pimeloyl-ACP methyl ester carboxylesterase